MKKIIYILLSACFFSCAPNSEEIFKGKLYVVEKPKTDHLIGEKIHFDGIYAGSLIVSDSVISFVYSYPDYFVVSYNLNTREHIGNFFRRGQGQGEFVEFGFLHPDVGNDYWINQFNKREYVLVDMSIGEEKKRINASEFKKNGGVPFIRAFILDDHQLIAVNQPEVKNMDGDIVVPQYQRINYNSKEEIGSYELFDENLFNQFRTRDDESYHLQGTYHIKPDKSKLVNVMRHLYQINILDLKTGKVEGFRLAGTSGFEFVHTVVSPGLEGSAYYHASVDDQYIYVFLSRQDVSTIHVFDWDGSLVRILTLDHNCEDIDLDKVNRKLYTKDDEENVWVYDVNYLYR